jgi:hypothetical protein
MQPAGKNVTACGLKKLHFTNKVNLGGVGKRLFKLLVKVEYNSKKGREIKIKVGECVKVNEGRNLK